MTAVQWWCSGVVLNRIFSTSTQQHHSVGPMSENVASKQDDLKQSPQQPSSAFIGQAVDRVA